MNPRYIQRQLRINSELITSASTQLSFYKTELKNLRTVMSKEDYMASSYTADLHKQVKLWKRFLKQLSELQKATKLELRATYDLIRDYGDENNEILVPCYC